MLHKRATSVQGSQNTPTQRRRLIAARRTDPKPESQECSPGVAQMGSLWAACIWSKSASLSGKVCISHLAVITCDTQLLSVKPEQPWISKRNHVRSTWLQLHGSDAEKAGTACLQWMFCFFSCFQTSRSFLFSLDVIAGDSRRGTRANVHWDCTNGGREKTHLTIKAEVHGCTNSITWEADLVNVASDPILMGVT